MVCTLCKARWAGFPLEDFKFTQEGIVARTPEAEKRRLAAYNSDTPMICEGCESDLNK